MKLVKAFAAVLCVFIFMVMAIFGGGGSQPSSAAAGTTNALCGTAYYLPSNNASPNLTIVDIAYEQTLKVAAQKTIDYTITHTYLMLALFETALVESGFHNWANDGLYDATDQLGASSTVADVQAQAASQQMPHDGIRSDHTSVGYLQQQMSWGTIAQRMDPLYATNAFLARATSLLYRSDIQTAGALAQAVQVSAFPSAYTDQEGTAQQYIKLAIQRRAQRDALKRAAQNDPAVCQANGTPLATNARAAGAVEFAKLQIGKPYVFATTGPDTFDCSGLTSAAWRSVGVQIVAYTGWQWNNLQHIPRGEEEPGDLALMRGSDEPQPSHVGIVVDPSKGLMIDASTDRIPLPEQINYRHYDTVDLYGFVRPG